jgi:hypothetical protein
MMNSTITCSDIGDMDDIGLISGNIVDGISDIRDKKRGYVGHV